jgi:hypothetical protein
MLCTIHVPYESHQQTILKEAILGQTMSSCDKHGWTNFIFIDGKKEKVCEKCFLASLEEICD